MLKNKKRVGVPTNKRKKMGDTSKLMPDENVEETNKDRPLLRCFNLTPHDINVFLDDGSEVKFEKFGREVRLQEENQMLPVADVNHLGVPIVIAPKYGGITLTGEGAYPRGIWLVSMPVGHYLAVHPEIDAAVSVYGPDTGPHGVVRNSSGAIIGTRRFVRYR